MSVKRGAQTFAQGTLMSSGVDPRTLIASLRFLPGFVSNTIRYAKNHVKGDPFPLRLGDLFPILGDAHSPSGVATGHYFHQDLYMAKRIFAAKPGRHVDVGSRVDGFVAHVLSFMPVTVVDVRPLVSKVDGLAFLQDDGATLAKFESDSVESLSSLHAVEHFGLGRYGDPVDPNAWRHAVQSYCRVLAPGGILYFAVPVGRERLEYNAHRVFSPSTILVAFSELHLIEFCAVTDAGDLDTSAHPADYEQAEYACGLFTFQKRHPA